jgi:hypothetical protein
MKRMLLLGAAALGLLPVCASAHDYHRDRYEDHHRRHSDFRYERRVVYSVEYRRDYRCGWQSGGIYSCRSEADAAACRLGRCGYQTRICE